MPIVSDKVAEFSAVCWISSKPLFTPLACSRHCLLPSHANCGDHKLLPCHRVCDFIGFSPFLIHSTWGYILIRTRTRTDEETLSGEHLPSQCMEVKLMPQAFLLSMMKQQRIPMQRPTFVNLQE